MKCHACGQEVKDLDFQDFVSVVKLLAAQPRLREKRTGRLYVPTGITMAGELALSALDGKSPYAWVIDRLDGFEIDRPKPKGPEEPN